MSVNKVNSDGSLSRVAGGTLYADLPVGSWIKWDGENLPSGFLKAGDAIDQTIYPELYAMYGSTVPYKADTSELDDFEEPFDPNIASIVTTGVIAQYDGFLYVNNFAPFGIEGGRSISINGVAVANLTKSSNVVITQNFCLPIKKGDVIKGSASNYLGSWIFKYYKKSLIVKAKQVAVPFDVAEYIRKQNSPDWDNAINISSNLSTSNYTITDDGWIAGNHYALGGAIGVAIEVNGIPVTSAGNNTNYGWVGQCMVKVSKGDKIKFNKTGFTNVDIYFVPHK